MDNDITTSTVLTAWNTPEHIHRERTIDWYWAVGLGAIAAAVLAFILKDTLFGIMILLASGLYAFASAKGPRDVSCSITEKDITIGTEVYEMEKIKAFNIVSMSEDEKDLVLSIMRFYNPVVSVHLAPNIENDVKRILNERLTYNEKMNAPVGNRVISRYKL